LSNSGAISTSGPGSYGITNQGAGTITTLNNTGTISTSGPGGVYGIYNLGAITTLNNRQGASGSALTYLNKLPTNYNIIIGGTTKYGQLAATSQSGTMVFGVSTTSTKTSSLVGQTLTGVLQGFGSNLSTYVTSGLTSSNGYTYTLTQQGSTGTWDLTITGVPSLTVTAVAVPSNATYGAGQDLSLTVNWSEAVDVTGTPRLALSIGSTTRYATYVSGSGTAALVFKYSVQSGDADTDGIAVGSSVDLNGGTIAATADATYTVNTALNSVGSTVAVLVVTTTAPGAPTSVAAVRGPGEAVVSFLAPVSNGGAAITSYTVTSSPGGVTATGASSPITITGLTNGTSYTFTVAATNSVATGSASSASTAITPAAASMAGVSFGAAEGTVQLRSTAVDAAGNIYLAGNFSVQTTLELGGVTLNRMGTQDAWVAKLNSNGTVVWAKNFGGSGARAYGRGIAVDGSGNVYFGGYFETANLTTPALTKLGTCDAFALKLDSSGATTWAKNFGGSGAVALGLRIAVDGSGNVYLGGYFDTANLTTPALTKLGTGDAFALKLDSSGATTWAKNYGGSGAIASCYGIAVDGSGNVYLGGFFDANLTTPALTRIGTQDAFALKLDSSGATTWAQNYGGSGARAYGYGIAVDGSGNVYLGGYFETANLTTPALTRIGSSDAFALKLDSSGAATWAKNFGGGGASAYAYGRGIAVDGSGNVYLG
jgi:hypothetical protein